MGLAAHLDDIDLFSLSDEALIEVIAAHEAQLAWAHAQQLLALMEFSRRCPAPDREFASDQIAPATTLTRSTAEYRLQTAETLRDLFPDVLELMLAGRISLAKAQMLAGITRELDDTTAREVLDGLLDRVPGWSTGQLRHHLRRAVLQADPDAARRRAEAAKAERDVYVSPGEHGNAQLGALLGAHDAAAALSVIDAAARAAHTDGDRRTIGQVRSDVLLDLILGRHRSGDRAPVPTLINVAVPMSTLTHLLADEDAPTGPGDRPGWIEKIGPVSGSVARELIRDLLSTDQPSTDPPSTGQPSSNRVGWRIIGCDDRTGAVHAVGHTRYRPPAALRELVQLRDRTCRFPGCRRRAQRCDVDHAIPFDPLRPGAVTCDCNLQCLCRHHHRLKQTPGWTVQFAGGISTWTSPTGHVYLSEPQSDWAGPGPSATRYEQWQPDGEWLVRTGWTFRDGELVRDEGPIPRQPGAVGPLDTHDQLPGDDDPPPY